jgi:asparagine synthase (glutamine-hydrolysing)
MCGIAGYLIKNSEIETNNSSIKKMLLLQKHRGPDNSGIVAINSKLKSAENINFDKETDFKNPSNLVFGFNRLSILDLSSNGHQPMKSIDGNVVLMLNGEVYNAAEFKDELIAKGFNFKGHSDTEVILNLYNAYGIEGMLERLNGMFAIVIWDAKINKLFLVRDRFGIKPLYILEEENRISFSSEIKSFKALPNFRFELDELNLDEFLLFRNLINKTLFKNIRNLSPGKYLEIDENGNYQEKTFYNLNDDGNLKIDTKQLDQIFANSLEKSVKSQLISDVKVGAQLSGGIDSSLVTYFAQKSMHAEDFQTISILFENSKFSEENYVAIVKSKLNLASNMFTLNQKYFFDVFDHATWCFEQPINHPNTIGLYLLSENAKDLVTVLLSGEGADEVLAGYSRFIDYKYHSFFSREFFSKLYFNKKNLFDFLHLYLNKENRIITASTFGSISYLKKLKPNFSFKKATANRKSLLRGFSGSKNNHRKYEMATYLPDLLMRQDKMSMAFSIENRVPFLDNNFVSLALSIDNEQLITKRKGKYEGKNVLKKLAANIFDIDFAYRAKESFSIPMKDFLGSDEFITKWNTEIKDSLKRRKIFDISHVNEIILNIKNANTAELECIWQMYTFEVWAQQYLDNDSDS